MINAPKQQREMKTSSKLPILLLSLNLLALTAILAGSFLLPLTTEARESKQEKHAAPAFSAKSPVADVAHRVSPAVVTVGTVAVKQLLVRDPFYYNNMFHVENVRERMPYLGSGVLVDKSGLIVTNHHVIQTGESCFVTFMDGREFEAEVVDADPYIDIAVLRIEADDLPDPIELGDSDKLQIGETAIAFGNPFGPMIADPQPSVTAGVVSALNRSFQADWRNEKVYQDMIQTDAAINPGNSGGPLVDAFGRVIGINSFIFSQSGGNQGVGFAIPVNRVRRILDEIRQYDHIRPIWLDFAVATIRGKGFQGVVVQFARENGPAESAGIEPGDIILEADGRRLYSSGEFELYFKGKQAGDTMEMKLVRKGEEIDVVYTIQTPPE